MKVGDYVRYKYENCIYIGKIKFISEVMGFDETLQFEIDNCIEEILKQDIIKSSPNIIDLIEEGDILKLLDVQYDKEYKTEVILDYNDNLCVIDFENDKIIDLKESLFKKDIKLLSIITKEQFEAIKYEIK